MKKIMCVFFVAIISLGIVGCSPKESFTFDQLGIEMKVRIGENYDIVQDDDGVFLFYAGEKWAFGMLDVHPSKGKTYEELCDRYLGADPKYEKEFLSDELVFLSVMEENYLFLFYDEEAEIIVWGRFLEPGSREEVIDIAESIEIEKI